MGYSTVKLMSKCLLSGKKTDGGIGVLPASLVDGLVLATAVASVLTLFLTSGTVVTMAACLTLAFAPLTAWQKRKLASLGTFRGQHNELRKKVNALTSENDKLGSTVDRLGSTVSRIEEVEKDLARLADTSNVNRLVKVVKEQKEITKHMREIIEREAIYQIIDIVIQSDKDQDFMIGTGEMDRLILGLENIQGLNVHRDTFKKQLGKKKKYTLGNILALLRNMMDNDVTEEEKIIVIMPQDVMEQ